MGEIVIQSSDNIMKNFDTKLEELMVLSNTTDITNYKEIKETLKVLRSFDKAMEVERKDFKELLLAPYNEFNEHYKTEMLPLRDEIERLREHQSLIEVEKAAQKEKEINKIIDETIDMLEINFEFDKNLLIRSQFYNQTVTLSQIEKEIEERLTEVKNNYENLETDLRLIYLEDFDLSRALAEKKRMDEIKIRALNEDIVSEEKKEEYVIVQIKKQDVNKLKDLGIEYKIMN